ncbi:MAG: hypothetical protein ABI164_08515, partial [Acidobacteriaceae bacterium]
TFGWLLVMGSLLQIIGSVEMYRGTPEMLVWALSGTLAGLLLAALNLLRVDRPRDRMLAWISFLGSVGWLAVVIAFGLAIGNLLDFRVATMGAIAIVLVIFSMRSATGTHAAP